MVHHKKQHGMTMVAAAKKAASRDMLKDFRSLRSQNRLAAIKVPGNDYTQ